MNKSQSTRPSWNEYFIKFAFLARSRSTCLRRKVGAIIVKNRQILTTGYNGRPRGLKHCSEMGCLREKLAIESGKNHEMCQGLHAEQNAIIQAAVHGISIKDSIIYCTTFPCSICMKMIINAGVIRVYYSEGYSDEFSRELLQEAGLEVIQLDHYQGEI